MGKPLYIFDLDGTLANITHRLPMIREASDWDGFSKACAADLPNTAVIGILKLLRDAGCEIWVFSGRSDIARAETEAWLYIHVGMNFIDSPCLMMRPHKDSRPDDELKQLWLNRMLDEDRARLVATFDDRKRVVDMWRRNGITCFQVAEGNF